MDNSDMYTFGMGAPYMAPLAPFPGLPYPLVSAQAMPPAPPAPTTGPLQPSACKITVRQQPKEALVTVKGREKSRKPLDPPPIVELSVDGTDQQFLNNPYIFMAVSLYKNDGQEPVDCTPAASLTGTLVSSLQRLKGDQNKEGAFFIFSDLSFLLQGRFRLRMSLYEMDPNYAQFRALGTTFTDEFHVVPPKEFKGLDQSTFLSRMFSDQGVRLRLRKDTRTVTGKRKQRDDVPADDPTYGTQPLQKRPQTDTPVAPYNPMANSWTWPNPQPPQQPPQHPPPDDQNWPWAPY